MEKNYQPIKSSYRSSSRRTKTAYETKDADAIKPKLEALDAAWMAASEELYKATQEAQPQPETAEQMQEIMYKMQTSKKSSKDWLKSIKINE